MAVLQPGSQLGAYRIVRLLGRGGMGAVYEAADARTGRPVALKVILPELVADPRLARRFDREARAAAAIRHENVARLEEAGQIGSTLFLAFELLRGGTLEQRIATSKRIPWREAARIGAAVAKGLAAIHAAGLVHRDLKPANVLFDERTPKIGDFGLVRREHGADDPPTLGGPLTKMGEVLGTPAFMSPEQADGSAVDARADVYALGAMLHAMLTGAPPFEGESFMIVKKLLVDRPKSVREKAPDVPEELAALVLRLLSKDPAERGDAVKVAGELDAFARGVATKEEAPRRKGPLVAALVLLGLAGAAVATAFALHATTPVSPPVSLPPPPVPRPSPPPPPPPTPSSPTDDDADSDAEPGVDDVAETNVPFKLVATWGEYQATHRRRGGKAESVSSPARRVVTPPGGEWLAVTHDHGFVQFRDPVSLEPLDKVPVVTGNFIRFTWDLLALDASTLLACGKAATQQKQHGYLARLPIASRQVAGWPATLHGGPDIHRIATNGKIVVGAGGDDSGLLEAHSVATGERLWSKETLTPLRAIAFVPGSPDRAVVGANDGSLVIWKVSESGAHPGRTLRPASMKRVDEIVFLDESRFFVAVNAVKNFVAAEGEVHLWTLEGGDERLLSEETSISALAYSSRACLVAGDGDGKIHRLSLGSGEAAPPIEAHTRPVMSLAFVPGDPDGLYSTGADSLLRVWNWRTGERRHEGEGHGNRVTALAVTPDGARLVSGSDDRTIRVWDIAARKPLHVYRSAETQALAVSPDGGTVVAGSFDGRHEPATKLLSLGVAAPWDAREIADAKGAFLGVSFVGESRVCAATWQDALLGLWPLDGSAPRTTSFKHGGEFPRAFAASGSRAIVAHETGDVRVYDVTTPGRTWRVDLVLGRGNRPPVPSAAAITADGRTVAVGYMHGVVLVWSARQPGERTRIPLTRGLRVNAIRFTRSGELYVASEDGTLRAFGRDGAPRWTWRLPRKDAPVALAFAGEKKLLVGTARGVILELEMQ